jgi:hypothetical protein
VWLLIIVFDINSKHILAASHCSHSVFDVFVQLQRVTVLMAQISVATGINSFAVTKDFVQSLV